MTNDEIIQNEFGDTDRQCMWQLTPDELPPDVNHFALEMWRTIDGKLVLFQFFIDTTPGPWYSNISAFARFDQTPTG